jgi:hypothetical protein
MSVNDRADCISNLTFDEWISGELGPAAHASLEAHLASCVRCRLRHDALMTERADFLDRAPSIFALHEQLPSHAAPRPKRAWFAGAAALVASVLLASFVASSERAEHAQSMVRRKGGVSLGCYVKRGQGVSRLQAGEAVAPGDQLRFVYTTQRPVYFALLSRDARSTTVHHPEGPRTVLVPAGHEVALDFGIELDDTPGSEVLYGLFCEKSVALASVRAALVRGDGLSIGGCTVDVLTLHKSGK